MSNQNVEVQLRKSFRRIFPEASRKDEDQFVQSCLYYVGLIDINSIPVDNTIDLEEDDIMKAAEIAVKNNIVVLEDECISFAVSFLFDISSLMTGNILPMVGTLFVLGCKLYKSRIKLDDNQMEFYKYLVAHDYTLQDRIAGGLDGGRGFVLNDAIEHFYEYKVSKGYSESKEVFMNSIHDIVSFFISKHLLDEKDHSKGRYIIRF